jgi:pimeloyl-ACP methyl ester carboxylesterase
MNQAITKSGILENNHTVNYVQQGEGLPVILVHGLAASLHDWDDLLPELAASGYTGYALDLLGHGDSYKPVHRSEYTVEKVFGHFSSWIDSLQIAEPMSLVGHSLGGALSLIYALRYPERVNALALINPFYDVKQLSPAIQSPFLRRLMSARFVDLTPYWLYRVFVDATSFNFSIGQGETHILPEHIRYQTALDFKRASSGIYNIVHTLPNLIPDLSRVHQPSLLLWGARDQTLDPRSFPKLEKKLPNVVASHSFPVCGHVPHQCHPDQLNPHVMKFLNELRPERSRRMNSAGE